MNQNLSLVVKFIVAFGLLAFWDVARADDDCALDPAFCSETPTPKPVRIKKPIAKKSPARGCRPQGSSFNLDNADLPVCAAKPKKEREVSFADFDEDDEMSFADFDEKQSKKRKPASVGGDTVSFDSYMRENTSHGSISSRVRNYQQAFVEAKRPAVYTNPIETGPGTSEGEGN